MGSASSRVSAARARSDLAPPPQGASNYPEKELASSQPTSLEAGQRGTRGPGRGARSTLIPSMFRSNRASGYVAVPTNIDVPRSEAPRCPERVVRTRGKGPAPPSFAKEVEARRAAAAAMPAAGCGLPTWSAESTGVVVACGAPPSALQEASEEVGCVGEATRKDAGGWAEEEASAGSVHGGQPAPSVVDAPLPDATAEEESIAHAEKVKQELLLLLGVHGETFQPGASHSQETNVTHLVAKPAGQECETTSVSARAVPPPSPSSAVPRPSPSHPSCAITRAARAPLRSPLLRSPTVRSPGTGRQLRGAPLSPLNVSSPALRDRYLSSPHTGSCDTASPPVKSPSPFGCASASSPQFCKGSGASPGGGGARLKSPSPFGCGNAAATSPQFAQSGCKASGVSPGGGRARRGLLLDKENAFNREPPPTGQLGGGSTKFSGLDSQNVSGCAEHDSDGGSEGGIAPYPGGGSFEGMSLCPGTVPRSAGSPCGRTPLPVWEDDAAASSHTCGRASGSPATSWGSRPSALSGGSGCGKKSLPPVATPTGTAPRGGRLTVEVA